MKCLTDNLYHEARGEPIKGQMLVARVTLNRAKPLGSICKAVYQPGQFSWTSKPKQKITDFAAYEQAGKAAYAALYYYRPYYYYHAITVKPDWARTKKFAVKVGNHLFYNERS
jgi:spore germination cell wall hydrolase CwlJ-like protein